MPLFSLRWFLWYFCSFLDGAFTALIVSPEHLIKHSSCSVLFSFCASKKWHLFSGGNMRHTENLHIQKKAKSNSRVRSFSCHYGTGQWNFSSLPRWLSDKKKPKQVEKKARVVKDSLTSLTPAEILLTSIPAAVAERNRLLHAPFASPGGIWLGEGPNSPREALHIILWLRLRWLSFITEGKGHRASYCNKRSGSCLLEARSLCVFYWLSCVGFGWFFSFGFCFFLVGSGDWVVPPHPFSLSLFSQKC